MALIFYQTVTQYGEHEKYRFNKDILGITSLYTAPKVPKELMSQVPKTCRVFSKTIHREKRANWEIKEGGKTFSRRMNCWEVDGSATVEEKSKWRCGQGARILGERPKRTKGGGHRTFWILTVIDWYVSKLPQNKLEKLPLRKYLSSLLVIFLSHMGSYNYYLVITVHET